MTTLRPLGVLRNDCFQKKKLIQGCRLIDVTNGKVTNNRGATCQFPDELGRDLQVPLSVICIS